MPRFIRRYLIALLLLWAVSANCAGLTLPFEDSMAQRVLACTGCHGRQGRAGPDGYYPRLAGKPAGYLFNQLRNFQSGRRHYGLMVNLLENLSDANLREMAEHFSRLDVPYVGAPALALPPPPLERGLELATRGDERLRLPACSRCHGESFMGFAPFVPSLLGLPRDYLNAQLGAWRSGERRAQAPDCMALVAQRMTPEDVTAVVGWLAAQPIPAITKAVTTLARPMPLDCGAVAAPDAGARP